MEIEVPTLTTIAADLVPDEIVTRGGSAPAAPLHERLRPGVPVGIVLDEATVTDAELRAFVAAERATARYVLFHLSLSLDPDDRAPVYTGWLSVTLTAGDGGDSPVIAWSLSPLRETRDVATVTRSLELGPELKLLSAKFTSQKTATRRQTVIEASGLQNSTPSWELRPEPGEQLSGSYPFSLVARGPAGRPIVAAVSASASVRIRRIFRAYHADVPGPATLVVTV